MNQYFIKSFMFNLNIIYHARIIYYIDYLYDELEKAHDIANNGADALAILNGLDREEFLYDFIECCSKIREILFNNTEYLFKLPI